MNTELTIVIPAKNEENAIYRLLRSLAYQTYPLHDVKIYLADAASTDKTVDNARKIASRAHLLGFEVIPGGLPAVGRNAGAALATSRFLLFLDADVELQDGEFLDRVMGEMKSKNLHCATTDIHCPKGKLLSKIAYGINSFFQRGSRFVGTPFSTGMCMFFEREEFNRLSGFNEKALFAEDYMLSRMVDWRRFRVVRGGVTTSDRRMQKMGYWKLAKLFFGTAMLAHRESQFTKDHGYWKS